MEQESVNRSTGNAPSSAAFTEKGGVVTKRYWVTQLEDPVTVQVVMTMMAHSCHAVGLALARDF